MKSIGILVGRRIAIFRANCAQNLLETTGLFAICLLQIITLGNAELLLASYNYEGVLTLYDMIFIFISRLHFRGHMRVDLVQRVGAVTRCNK